MLNGIAELVEARTGTILWSDQYQRELTDVLMVQKYIAREVSNALLSTVSGEPRLAEVEAESEAEHSPARDSYIEGRDLLAKRTPEALRRSMDLFETAVRRAGSACRMRRCATDGIRSYSRKHK